ncbi:MAG: EAL domain-containing protein [Pseudomonadota bacterium]|nr:EAL domain-containing protein [Pseudomonadota bacterium]MDP1903604.1 EAL domain-containing protein [Pseudomonadota bacterium]MDP2353928.1 EAL domain-containing protein [Pseudomonadota bacterium]
MSQPRPRVLIADDELTARLLMRAALEKSGFEVCLAEDGEEALRAFQAQPCALVMLDVEMPGMDGFQVCAQLRRYAGEELPIVMVTGMDDLASIERAYEVGATDFIAKPINWALIGHRARYLLRAYQVLRDLHQANARNTAILNAIPDLLFEVDLDGRFLNYHSPRQAPQRTPPEHFLGRTVAESLPPDATQVCLEALHEADEKGMSSGRQYALALPQGNVWFELSVSRKEADAGGKSTFIVLSRDITERKEAEGRIFKLAYFDSLTGLPNRISFSERLHREIQRASHHGGKLAVLFLDLDGFKNVNDTLGHGAGDILLQWVADRLEQSRRPADVMARVDCTESEIDVARLGGDEFTLLLPDLRHPEHALGVAQRIHEQMRRPFSLEGREVALSTSIGIAIYPDDGEDAATLLKHADTAMYHAKKQGRDNCQFYSASLTREVMRRLDLESALRRALEREEFFLVYQPQLDLASGRILSLEALLRWNHPEWGVIAPPAFIHVAEENGLIVPLGEWVLRTACAEAVHWQSIGQPLRVAVNISAVQFRNRRLVDNMGGILRETGLPAELLELEVTEGVLMDDSDTTRDTLAALRAMGLRLALDDFGTGYSSLSYLKRLPLHSLKIDQSFIQGLPADRENMAIVRAIVALANNLGFSVTAEGIETLEQARLLCDLDCERLQGFYISEPVVAEAIPALLARHWCLEGSLDLGAGR